MASTAFQWVNSTSPNIPSLVTQGLAYSSSNVTGSTVANHLPRTWVFSSSFTLAEVGSSAFFGAHAKELGFQRGDLMQVWIGTTACHYISVAINPTSSGFVTWTTGSAII